MKWIVVFILVIVMMVVRSEQEEEENVKIVNVPKLIAYKEGSKEAIINQNFTVKVTIFNLGDGFVFLFFNKFIY